MVTGSANPFQTQQKTFVTFLVGGFSIHDDRKMKTEGLCFYVLVLFLLLLLFEKMISYLPAFSVCVSMLINIRLSTRIASVI